jgi:hypothetical protein
LSATLFPLLILNAIVNIKSWVREKKSDFFASKWAFQYDPKQESLLNPDLRQRWLIPLSLVVQYFIKTLVFDRILVEDGYTGDRDGPFDAETIDRNRTKAHEEHERRDLQRKLVKKMADAYASPDFLK